MNTALTEQVRYEFLSWINAQLRNEVEKRAAEKTHSQLVELRQQMKWIARLHVALVAGLSFASVTVLVCMQG